MGNVQGVASSSVASRTRVQDLTASYIDTDLEFECLTTDVIEPVFINNWPG